MKNHPVRMTDTHRIVHSPWPEREGLTCTIVERPPGRAGNVYPWPGLGKNEVVIRISDDPIGAAWNGWSCVLNRRLLEPLA